MTESLRILALIPARGGSKRLPGKNKRLLGGKPLICWSIQAAQGIPEICDILISTDDPETAEISKAAGVLVPWLRPKELASDTATSVDVALHALDWYEKEHGEIDGLLLLQPTSPFRTVQSIEKALQIFENDPSCPVVSISPTHAHPLWAMKLEGDYCVPFFGEHGLNKRSQDLEPAYTVNGSIYLYTKDYLRNTKSDLAINYRPLVIESQSEVLDIDDINDFDMAEKMLSISLSDNLK
jgi:CMP-N,N'-diacetyllegionaminic acid synthase